MEVVIWTQWLSRYIVCKKFNKALKFVPPASWLHRTRAAHAPLN